MRVLIVEDQPNVATYLKRALTEQGYAVDIAKTGQEALDWASVVTFDLILLDLMLPEIDGIAVCRRLRATGNEAAILMLTARDTVDDRVMGLDAGADDYLVKPFELKELLARLRALGRRKSTKSIQLRVADLTLDPLTRIVARGGVIIALTAKEYAVLECLMRDPHRVLTRTEIAESVWNYDVYNQSNVVDVYISYLRSKIDQPYGKKLIKTVRSVGYIIKEDDNE